MCSHDNRRDKIAWVAGILRKCFVHLSDFYEAFDTWSSLLLVGVVFF